MKPDYYTTDVLEQYSQLSSDSMITEKEWELWAFILSAYGTNEFSTKQLEKDFGNAAYATIRTFVLKFEENGLLKCKKLSNRNRYYVSK